MRRSLPPVLLALVAASVASGCLGGADDCRTFPDTPRIIHRHPRAVDAEEAAATLRELGWTTHADRHGATDRAYGALELEGPRLVLAYYDARPHGSEGSSVEVFALGVSSDSEARTRALVAAAAPALAAFNATLGEPSEVKIESLTRMCATGWSPKGCDPAPQVATRAPWEAEPPTPAQGDACRPLIV